MTDILNHFQKYLYSSLAQFTTIPFNRGCGFINGGLLVITVTVPVTVTVCPSSSG